jgi:hypothetical protein
MAAGAGLGTYGAYKGIQKIGEALRPVAPGPMPAPTAPVTPQGMAPRPSNVTQLRPVAPQQSMANQVKQQAANRIIGMGGAAAVPAAVGMGGAAATGLAGGQMRAMTPEQRKAYYDSTMMGAMSGDAGLAAAIMNRGQ